MSLINNDLPHLRLAIELNLAAHGTQKFFGWFGAELGDVQRVSLPRHALGGAFWALASLGVSTTT